MDEDGLAEAPPDAGGGNAMAAPATTQLPTQVNDDAWRRRRQRVADGDRAAVDVDALRVPLGSSNTRARSCGQNSPSWPPSGVILTFWAKAGWTSSAPAASAQSIDAVFMVGLLWGTFLVWILREKRYHVFGMNTSRSAAIGHVAVMGRGGCAGRGRLPARPGGAGDQSCFGFVALAALGAAA